MNLPATDSRLSVLAVRAGPQLCALPAAHVAEVMRPLPVAPLAGAPPAVLGLAVIRGQPTPVVDLAALLAARAPGPPAASARFVALRIGVRPVALQVDEVLALRALERDELAALPPLWQGPQPPAVTALGARDRELLLVLETARVLPAAPPSHA